MMEMNFGNDIDLKAGQGPTYAAGGPEIFTYRYPDGFKTGIYRYRLVSMGRDWYRFLNCLGNPGFSLSTYEKFKIHAFVCRFMSKQSIDVDGGPCGKTLIGNTG